MTKKKILKQLTIEGVVERNIRQTQKECEHRFGLAAPVFDYESDTVFYFAICDKCNYQIN